MGVVYEAEQLSLNRRVALKVLPLAATVDARQLERFRHEARAAGLLHHANIVPVYGVGCERGIHYYAMQLIEGCSLADVISEWRRLAVARADSASECAQASTVDWGAARTPPPTTGGTFRTTRAKRCFRRIAELLAQAAEAVGYAHTMGVMHRDVKPANLMLDASGNVWITDFGLARLGEGPGVTMSGDLLGTLRYMSPEQALGGHNVIDHRTDIYSLGATLYELLTLQPAVDGASKEEVLHRLAFEEPLTPRKIDRSIPLELETVTLKALAKDPQERYPTAQAFAGDLRRWLDDRPILARSPSLVQRFRKWSRRHRGLVVGLATFLLLAVAGFCVAAVEFGVKQRELADQQSRFAAATAQSERKLAEKLREVLVDRAEAIRLARRPGYRQRVWADLRQAITLPRGETNVDQIRETVLACLGDPVGLEPIQDVKNVRRQTLPELPYKAAVGGTIAVSARGDRMAMVGPAGRIDVYDAKTKLVWQEPSPLGAVYGLALATDGKVLVAGCEQGFVAWNLPGRDKWVARIGNVFSAAIAPRGDVLAIAGRQFELWSLTTKHPIASWPAPESGARPEFSADGQVLLAIANEKAVAGWAVSDTPEKRMLEGHMGGVPAIAFSPDGRQLVSVSKDRTVRVWDAVTGSPLRTLTGHRGEIEAVAFSGDGSLLATGDLVGSVRIWNAASGALGAETGSGEPPGQVWRLQFGSGGEYLAAAGASVVVWTVRAASDRLELKRLRTLATRPESPGAIDVAARPRGTELIYLDRGGRMYSYDLALADDPRFIGNARVALRSLHFTPTGNRLAFVTPHGTLGLWNCTGKAVGAVGPRTGHELARVKLSKNLVTDTRCRAESVALSADGRWAALVMAGRSITVADLDSGRKILALPPERCEIWSVAWAPEATKLAVGLSDGGVAVWDLEQVRARLADFGLDSPSTARAGEAFKTAPIPEFDRVARLNLLREEEESARRRAAAAREAGDVDEEQDELAVALKLGERLAEAVPEAGGHRQRLAWAHRALARALARLGNTAAALSHLDADGELVRRLSLEDPGNRDYRRLIALGLTVRAEVLDRAGRKTEAADAARQAMAVRADLAADPGTSNDRDQLGVAYNNLGLHLWRAGKTAEAERWYNAAVAARERLAHDDPAIAEGAKFLHGQGGTLHNLGVLRAQAGDSARAAKLLREAVVIRIRLADNFPGSADYASDAGRSLDWMGGMLRNLGQLDESANHLRDARERQGRALSIRPNDPVIRELCWNHNVQLAITLLRMGRHALAADAAREIPRLAHDDPAALIRAARLLAGCVGVAKRNPGFPWALGLAQAQGYGSEASALARDAVAHGLKDAVALLSKPDFNSLRDRDEFRSLLAEIRGRKG
jgi:WD40 repeat protein